MEAWHDRDHVAPYLYEGVSDSESKLLTTMSPWNPPATSSPCLAASVQTCTWPHPEPGKPAEVERSRACESPDQKNVSACLEYGWECCQGM